MKGKSYSIEELVLLISDKLYEEFDIESGISERQLLDDIRVMRKSPPEGYGAPIVRKKGILSYTDKKFTIQSSPLISKDLDALKEVISVLKQLSDIPHYYELKNVYDKLCGTMTFGQFKEKDVHIQFEMTTLTRGKQFIQPLYNFIKKKQTVSILYKPYHEDALIFTLHPYLLKEYNNRWFLIAWSDKFEKVINIAVDRIERIDKSQNTFREQSKKLIPDYAKIVGVTIPEGKVAEKVILKVNPQRLPYLITKPIHSSQILLSQNDDKSGLLELSLIPNFEFKSMILSHGAAVEVISPAYLRKELQKEVLELYRKYQK